jgi:hypothetical protein
MQYVVYVMENIDYWMVRIYSGAELCGKMRLDTATKDALVAKFVELGWTEMT